MLRFGKIVWEIIFLRNQLKDGSALNGAFFIFQFIIVLFLERPAEYKLSLRPLRSFDPIQHFPNENVWFAVSPQQSFLKGEKSIFTHFCNLSL